MRRRVSILSGALLGASCLLSGCGGASSALVDPCTLVTSAEASAALGVTVGSAQRPPQGNVPPNLATCAYSGPRGQDLAVMVVMVQRSDDAAQARRSFDSAKARFPGATAVADVGDEAFTMMNQLNVLVGSVYLNINANIGLETATQLARQAVQRLR